MFELSEVVQFLKVEPGHGFVQSFLLLMIWLNSRNLKKELQGIRDALSETKAQIEYRFLKIEERVSVLEHNRGA